MNRFTKKTFGVRPHSILLALMENLEIWSVTSWTETLYQLISKVKMIKYSQCCQLFITNLPNKFWSSLYFQNISIIICAIFFYKFWESKLATLILNHFSLKFFCFLGRDGHTALHSACYQVISSSNYWIILSNCNLPFIDEKKSSLSGTHWYGSFLTWTRCKPELDSKVWSSCSFFNFNSISCC